MPITLQDLRREERTITLDYNGDELEITYKPSALTPEMEETIRTATERERPLSGIAQVVSMLVVDWEVLDENGNHIFPDLEFCMTLPNEFLSAVLVAVIEDNRAGREERKNLDGGSERKGGSAKSRTGTR
jgi:hypothetical protein